MMARLFNRQRLPALILLTYIVSSLALTCPPPGRVLPPTSCLSLPTTNTEESRTANFMDSQQGCMDDRFTGLAVVTNEQFANLASYAEVLGRADEFYWLGYSYRNETVLEDVSMLAVAAGSAILLPANYGPGQQQDARQGVCIAIGKDGRLYSRLCEELLGSFCQLFIQAPSASINASPSRFVTDSVTLTCSVSGSDVDVSWLASFPPSPVPEVISNQNMLVINSFSAEEDAGTYYCVASNQLGRYVSNPVVLVAGPDTSTGSEVPDVNVTVVGHGPPLGYLFGEFLLVVCDFSTGSSVQWFINGRPLAETTRVNPYKSELEVEALQEEGFYQCFVVTDDGLGAGDGVLVEARPSISGVIDTTSAEPNAPDELFVSWLCPEILNTHDPALLRYNILYHRRDAMRGFTFNNSLALNVPNVVPVLLNGVESEDCVVEARIAGLEVGTSYLVKIIGRTSSGMDGREATQFAVAATYGTVPPVIMDLKVTRSPDNKVVQATWGKVETTPPVGFVSRYQIEYRDSSKGSVATVFHSRRYNYLVVENVIDANSYEVRVSSGVVVQRDPVLYTYSDFSAWVKVDGVRIVSPTEGGLSTLPSPRVGAVAAGVVVGVLVCVLILAILMMGIFCCCYRKADQMSSKKKESSPSSTLGLSNLPGDEQKLPD